MTDSPGPYAAPIPRHFYVHDDVTDDVNEIFGPDSVVADLVGLLFRTISEREPERVRVLNQEEQIEALITAAEPTTSPSELTLGIGTAGERVALQLNERTGWFPHIHRIDVTRREDGRGGYEIVSTSGTSLADQLAGLEDVESLAIVDDTIFSGITMRSVLQGLPEAALPRTRSFCLRCVGETLDSLQGLRHVSAGFCAPGRILEDVSFISASGLVTRVGIRRLDGLSMAFYERPEWMQAWFPGYADEVSALARKITDFLTPEGGEVIW